MSLILSSLLALLPAAFAQSPDESLTCTTGKIVLSEFAVESSQESVYCYNKDKTLLVSKSCEFKNCEAFASEKRFELQDLQSPLGKPGAKACYELGGNVELLEFQADGELHKLDRCLFPDGSFADTDFLLSHYLER